MPLLEGYGGVYMKEYTLNGSEKDQNIDRRVNLLTALFDRADLKGNHISELRQKNLNYALIIFAGLFTFTMKFPSKLYSVFISAALLGIMIVFCLLDRRYHKFIHGWRKTKTMFMEKVADVINEPRKEVSFVRYLKEEEKTAEFRSLQPIIFYCLVFSGLVHVGYFVYTTVIK